MNIGKTLSEVNLNVYGNLHVYSHSIPVSSLYQHDLLFVRRVRRYQRGNHNPYIEEEQTTQRTNKNLQHICIGNHGGQNRCITNRSGLNRCIPISNDDRDRYVANQK